MVSTTRGSNIDDKHATNDSILLSSGVFIVRNSRLISRLFIRADNRCLLFSTYQFRIFHERWNLDGTLIWVGYLHATTWLSRHYSYKWSILCYIYVCNSLKAIAYHVPNACHRKESMAVPSNLDGIIKSLFFLSNTSDMRNFYLGIVRAIFKLNGE